MTPDAIEALRRIFQAQQSEIRVGFFARITAFHNNGDPAGRTPTVNVQPVVSEVIESAEGARDFEPLPELLDLPFMLPQSGGVFISWEPSVGDVVWVAVSAQDFSEWFATGQDSHANDSRTHALNNAVAHPCGFSTGNGPKTVTGAMVIQAPEIRMGLPTAALHFAVAELVKAEFARIIAGFDPHIHATPMGPSGPPMLPTTVPIVLTPAGEVKSVRVKVDS